MAIGFLTSLNEHEKQETMANEYLILSNDKGKQAKVESIIESLLSSGKDYELHVSSENFKIEEYVNELKKLQKKNKRQ